MTADDQALRERIAQAEAAVAALTDVYLANVKQEIEELRGLSAAMRRSPGAHAEAAEQIFTIAHNIKGQGGSFGFDLVTQVGSSLCEITRHQRCLTAAELARVDDHVRVLDVIVQKGIRGDGGALGAQLIEKLGGQAQGPVQARASAA